MFNSKFDSGASMAPGFIYNEAKEFVKFCIELNSQDDRKDPPLGSTPSVYQPNIDARWETIFDSREQVARTKSKINPDKKCTNDTQCKEIFNDPTHNGFGPFQNAWVLYKDTTAANTYAIAIRGTVIRNNPTLIEDLLATTIPAKDGIEFREGKFAPVRFADLAEAEVHVGFAYGTFVTLFDKDFGILKQLDDWKIPVGSKIFIVGHSQGAAMATLTHAFLHYAMRDKQFGLGDMNFNLKSYAFAQPKPGNLAFSMDFANITHLHNNAIVINNTLDVVPKVPFTFELAADWDTDIQGRGILISALHGIANLGMKFRGLFSSAVEKKIAEAKKLDNLYRSDELLNKAKSNIHSGVSLNYVSAGTITPVDGYQVNKNDMTTPYTGQPNDPFIQHHMPTYQQLINEKFGSP